MERERSRIARDIHDDLGSRLTRISMVTQQAMREVPPGHGVASHFNIISETARDMLDRLDETVWVVNPRNDQLDRLCDYLLNYAQDFFQHTGIRCRFKVTDDIPPLPMAAEMRHHVFLVVKEALNNAARHAGATEVRIQLGFCGRKLSLAITDNGRGFDTAACLALGRGLENMRSRVANLGGWLELESHPGQGSVVRMEFEITAPDAAERHAEVSSTKAGGVRKA
jgi:signal transduction histidine kinase